MYREKFGGGSSGSGLITPRKVSGIKSSFTFDNCYNSPTLLLSATGPGSEVGNK